MSCSNRSLKGVKTGTSPSSVREYDDQLLSSVCIPLYAIKDEKVTEKQDVHHLPALQAVTDLDDDQCT